MSLPETQYAIFFPEGPGYLFISVIGEGAEGQAQLVRSLKDGKLYVRKKTRERPVPLYKGQVPEVAFYRNHKSIPTLFDSTDYPVEPIPGAMYPERATSMIFQYCNGGTLHDFCRAYRRKDEQIPERTIWTFFSQIMHVVDFLQQNQPPIGHGDMHTGNIFLHWAESHQQIPDFFVGDFGLAMFITDESESIPEMMADGDQWQDYNVLRVRLSELMQNHLSGRRPSTKPAKPYSISLQACCQELFRICNKRSMENAPGELRNLRARIDDELRKCVEQIGKPVRTPVADSKVVFSSDMTWLTSHWKLLEGPWQVAEVNLNEISIRRLHHAVYNTSGASKFKYASLAKPKYNLNEHCKDIEAKKAAGLYKPEGEYADSEINKRVAGMLEKK